MTAQEPTASKRVLRNQYTWKEEEVTIWHPATPPGYLYWIPPVRTREEAVEVTRRLGEVMWMEANPQDALASATWRDFTSKRIWPALVADEWPLARSLSSAIGDSMIEVSIWVKESLRSFFIFVSDMDASVDSQCKWGYCIDYKRQVSGLRDVLDQVFSALKADGAFASDSWQWQG